MASLNKQIEKADCNYVYIKIYCDDLYDETKLYLIDADDLKNMYNNGPLEGAKIFAYLFGIDDNTPFKKDDIDVEIDLTDFNVNLKIWTSFYGFLRNGFLSQPSMAYKEDLYEFVIAMGGVPSFEKYYKNICEIYNPMTPTQDVKNTYKWTIVSIPSGYTGSASNLLNPTDSITENTGSNYTNQYYVRCIL